MLLEQVGEKPCVLSNEEKAEVVGPPEVRFSRSTVAILESLKDEVASVDSTGGTNFEKTGRCHCLEVGAHGGLTFKVFEAMKDRFERDELGQNIVLDPESHRWNDTYGSRSGA
jgi:hypothetical protein